MLQTIRPNDTGDLVKVAQYLLKYVEINQANGIYDETFTNYVINWQSENNLEPDGIIGKKTWITIATTLPTCSTSKNKKSTYTCAIQILLGGLTVDGIYGNGTKKAVAAYQSANKLAADGICGAKTWNALVAGQEKDEPIVPSSSAGQIVNGDKVLNNCVKYLQWDSKWKKVIYTSTGNKSQNIGNSGCGPTSMAMIMATFIDPKITPVEMCALAVKQGYRTANNGTSWGFYKYIFKHYDGFEKYIETSSVSTLIAAIREGALAVCSMNSNDGAYWTKGGHFIVARGCDNAYIYANDPNKSETPRKQKIDKFQSCMKQAFIFWPKQFIQEDEPSEEETVVNVSQEFKLDGQIVDISKYDGDINFDELKEVTSLVIARTTCGLNKDVKFDEYATEMNKRNIPFGVYCYSKAATEKEAIEEARKLVEYAHQYNPLFYVLDAEYKTNTQNTLKAFIDELHVLKVNKTGCYIAHNHYVDFGYANIKDLFDFTWIPRYGKNDGTLESSIKPKYPCDLWQYTSEGHINGINGDVDLNVITGDGHDLKWFLTQ